MDFSQPLRVLFLFSVFFPMTGFMINQVTLSRVDKQITQTTSTISIGHERDLGSDLESSEPLESQTDHLCCEKSGGKLNCSFVREVFALQIASAILFVIGLPWGFWTFFRRERELALGGIVARSALCSMNMLIFLFSSLYFTFLVSLPFTKGLL